MKTTYVLDFSPPMQGLDGIFNTVRLGVRFSRLLVPNDRVLMVERPKSALIGVAVVKHIVVGHLCDVARDWAPLNHNQKSLDPEGAAERLIANMVKRYGPQKCRENSKVTMVLLQRER